jgi:ElaB/YqjD/DUF883 family membrane-anchored ribosome-binding protein
MAETTANGIAKVTKPRKTKAPVTPVAPSVDPVSAAAASDNVASAKSRFGKAVDEARAGAEALRDEALQRGTAYKDKLAGTTGDWQEEAKAYAGQAKEKAATLAKEGKTRASDALAAVGKTIAETAPTVDEKLGPQYGDYARNAARWTQETAARIEAKEFGELGEDIKAFVKKSPGTAIGIAAVAGFVVARMLSGGGNSGSED